MKNDTLRPISPTKIKEDTGKPIPQANLIKANLKSLIEEKPAISNLDLKLKENPIQKNFPSCESPILKIVKKQKSKQIAEMTNEFLCPEVKNSSINSLNSLENEFISPEVSPKKPCIKTPQPMKSGHKISKSTFLQHKYLENLVSKPSDNITHSKEKEFTINLNNVPINEVDASNEETPNNLTLKFNFLNSQKKEHTPTPENNRKTFAMKIPKGEIDVLEDHPFRHLIFSPKISDNLFKKHLLITYKGVIYSQKLQDPSESFLKSRVITLPKDSDKPKTLFMDLDETLIHSCHLRENPQIVLSIGTKQIGFNVRPYCKEFLEKISQYYEVYLFTASTEAYAKAIIDNIDKNKIIRGLFTDKVTMNTKNGFIIKDLRIFENRDLKDMIIVDNLAHCFSYQIDNGVPLLEWQSDLSDRELKYLYGYLKKAANYHDVRDYNKKMLKLRELGQLSLDDLKL